MSKAKGISIHVGVNQVESKTIEARRLKGCEEDARAMFEIAKGSGFMPGWAPAGKASPLLGSDATYENVTKAVESAADALESGDIFLFTFAGHGTQTLDSDAEDDSDDLLDESILLVDHVLLDNYWKSHLWPKFKAGVRAVAVADCCHSETALVARSSKSPGKSSRPDLITAGKGFDLGFTRSASKASKAAKQIRTLAVPSVGVRGVSGLTLGEELKAFPEIYDEQRKKSSKTVGAICLFLSACEDSELAADGEHHGAFTQALLDVWDDGRFEGDYVKLMETIKDKRAALPNQHPVLTPKDHPPPFSSQRPFSV